VRRKVNMRSWLALPSGFLVLAATLIVAQPAFARITRIRQTPSETWNPLLPLVIGSGLEIQTDKDETSYEFPMLFEYNFTEEFKISIEPNYVLKVPRDPQDSTIEGWGDLETSAEWEFLKERRWRPALTAELIIKWPTHASLDTGDPGRDYSFGLVASKDFVYFDMDISAIYTFVGARDAKNSVEIDVDAEYHLTHYMDLIAEIATTFGGNVRGRPGLGGVGGGQRDATKSSDIEGTVGLSWKVNKHLKLEEGIVYNTDGSWKFVVAWEYSISGED